MANEDIITPLVRGRIARLVDFLTPTELTDCWLSAGYRLMTLLPPIPDETPQRRIMRTYSGSNDWTNPEMVKRGMLAFSLISEEVHLDHSYSFDFPSATHKLDFYLNQVGYQLESDGSISQLPQVREEMFDIDSLDDPRSIRKAISRLESSRVRAKDDPEEVISKAKSLVETACDVIIEKYDRSYKPPSQGILNHKAGKCLEILGVQPTNPNDQDMRTLTYRMADKARQIVVAVNGTRNKAGGDHTVQMDTGVELAHAQLVTDAAILWCRYVLNIDSTLATTVANKGPF